jgi:hypothetical protein
VLGWRLLWELGEARRGHGKARNQKESAGDVVAEIRQRHLSCSLSIRFRMIRSCLESSFSLTNKKLVGTHGTRSHWRWQLG